MRDFLPPLALSLLLIAMAAASRQVSDRLQSLLGSRFAPMLGGILGLAAIVVVCSALWRIRSRRFSRYSLVVLGLVLVLAPALLAERAGRDQAAVERMHFLFYGGLGILYLRAFGRRRGAIASLLAFLSAGLVGVFDEGYQWWLARRTGELFDLLLNFYATFCGIVLGLGLLPVETPIDSPDRRRSRSLAGACLLLAALALSVAGFVDVVHLGHRVVDRDGFSFRSYYSRQELLDLDRQREQSWRSRPPRRPPPSLEREDYFQTEAGEHVRLRNRAFAAGEMAIVVREQQILDRYYSSFLALDERYPDQPFRFRLPQWDLERARREATTLPAGYVSEADAGRIWLRPKRSLLWSGAGVLAMGLVVLAGALAQRQPAMDSSAR